MYHKFQVLLWFLKRPNLYPQFFRLIYSHLFTNKKNLLQDKDKSVSWCEEMAVDTWAAINKVTGETISDDLFLGKFQDVFAGAYEMEKKCPVKMGGPGNLNLIYWLMEYINACNVIETGVAYGWSSLAILLSLKNRPNSKLISTDMPYINWNNDSYVGCVVPEDLRSKWCILHSADREALPKALLELQSIDLCHYDSDKTYGGRMWAYQLLWNALRPGGLFISDDIGDNLAFKDFANKVKSFPIVVRFEDKYNGVLVK